MSVPLCPPSLEPLTAPIWLLCLKISQRYAQRSFEQGLSFLSCSGVVWMLNGHAPRSLCSACAPASFVHLASRLASYNDVSEPARPFVSTSLVQQCTSPFTECGREIKERSLVVAVHGLGPIAEVNAVRHQAVRSINRAARLFLPYHHHHASRHEGESLRHSQRSISPAVVHHEQVGCK